MDHVTETEDSYIPTSPLDGENTPFVLLSEVGDEETEQQHDTKEKGCTEKGHSQIEAYGASEEGLRASVLEMKVEEKTEMIKENGSDGDVGSSKINSDCNLNNSKLDLDQELTEDVQNKLKSMSREDLVHLALDTWRKRQSQKLQIQNLNTLMKNLKAELTQGKEVIKLLSKEKENSQIELKKLDFQNLKNDLTLATKEKEAAEKEMKTKETEFANLKDDLKNKNIRIRQLENAISQLKSHSAERKQQESAEIYKLKAQSKANEKEIQSLNQLVKETKEIVMKKTELIERLTKEIIENERNVTLPIIRIGALMDSNGSKILSEFSSSQMFEVVETTHTFLVEDIGMAADIIFDCEAKPDYIIIMAGTRNIKRNEDNKVVADKMIHQISRLLPRTTATLVLVSPPPILTDCFYNIQKRCLRMRLQKWAENNSRDGRIVFIDPFEAFEDNPNALEDDKFHITAATGQKAASIIMEKLSDLKERDMTLKTKKKEEIYTRNEEQVSFTPHNNTLREKDFNSQQPKHQMEIIESKESIFPSEVGPIFRDPTSNVSHDVVLRARIRSRNMGAVIGAGGCTIKAIRYHYSAHIELKSDGRVTVIARGEDAKNAMFKVIQFDREEEERKRNVEATNECKMRLSRLVKSYKASSSNWNQSLHTNTAQRYGKRQRDDDECESDYYDFKRKRCSETGRN